jgi:hypothetical protein
MRTFITFVLALAGLAQASGAERTDKIFLAGLPAGTQTVQTEATGAMRAEYSYNDRGRAITSSPLGESILLVCRPNTKAAAMIT